MAAQGGQQAPGGLQELTDQQRNDLLTRGQNQRLAEGLVASGQPVPGQLMPGAPIPKPQTGMTDEQKQKINDQQILRERRTAMEGYDPIKPISEQERGFGDPRPAPWTPEQLKRALAEGEASTNAWIDKRAAAVRAKINDRAEERRKFLESTGGQKTRGSASIDQDIAKMQAEEVAILNEKGAEANRRADWAKGRTLVQPGPTLNVATETYLKNGGMFGEGQGEAVDSPINVGGAPVRVPYATTKQTMEAAWRQYVNQEAAKGGSTVADIEQRARKLFMDRFGGKAGEDYLNSVMPPGVTTGATAPKTFQVPGILGGNVGPPMQIPGTETGGYSPAMRRFLPRPALDGNGGLVGSAAFDQSQMLRDAAMRRGQGQTTDGGLPGSGNATQVAADAHALRQAQIDREKASTQVLTNATGGVQSQAANIDAENKVVMNKGEKTGAPATIATDVLGGNVEGPGWVAGFGDPDKAEAQLAKVQETMGNMTPENQEAVRQTFRQPGNEVVKQLRDVLAKLTSEGPPSKGWAVAKSMYPLPNLYGPAIYATEQSAYESRQRAAKAVRATLAALGQ